MTQNSCTASIQAVLTHYHQTMLVALFKYSLSIVGLDTEIYLSNLTFINLFANTDKIISKTTNTTMWHKLL